MEVPLLVTDFLRRAVKLYPAKEAVVDRDERFTYAEFGARVNQLAHALRELGVAKGDRVAIVSPNSHQCLETFYGTALLGSAIVPVNFRLIASDFEYIVNHSGAKVFIVYADYTEAVDGLRGTIPTVEHFVVVRSTDSPVGAGWTDYEDLLAGRPQTAPTMPEMDENDLLSINYTSGTTARPKGVMLTHRNMYINAYHFIAHFQLSPADRELWTLPMFHVNGWGGVYALTAVGGTHVVLRAIDDAEIYRLIEREKITFACMAPAVLARILDYPHKERHTITTRPRFVLAGAPPPQTFVERLENELGWHFMQLYGLTETSPILTVCDAPRQLDPHGERYFEAKARAGQEAIGTEIRVVDADGNDVPQDDTTIGEVIARANVVFKGYWQQPEETAKAIRDGYFYTSDLATVNADSSINIVDRVKDVILSGGENISSIEIERALYDHPAVLEAAVIGIPSERWGETPLAIIVPRDGSYVTADEISDHCRASLAHFKCPSRIEFVDALPRTSTGKLKKFELREQYWEGHERRVH